MSSNSKFTSCIGIIAISVFFLIIGTAVNGWALSLLWRWFVVPIFEVSELTIIQAIGIAMIVGFLTSDLQNQSYESKDFTDLIGNYVGRSLIYPVITVIIGWIISGLG